MTTRSSDTDRSKELLTQARDMAPHMDLITILDHMEQIGDYHRRVSDAAMTISKALLDVGASLHESTTLLLFIATALAHHAEAIDGAMSPGGKTLQ